MYHNFKVRRANRLKGEKKKKEGKKTISCYGGTSRYIWAHSYLCFKALPSPTSDFAALTLTLTRSTIHSPTGSQPTPTQSNPIRSDPESLRLHSRACQLHDAGRHRVRASFPPLECRIEPANPSQSCSSKTLPILSALAGGVFTVTVLSKTLELTRPRDDVAADAVVPSFALGSPERSGMFFSSPLVCFLLSPSTYPFYAQSSGTLHRVRGARGV